jgi:hypothetical protein
MFIAYNPVCQRSSFKSPKKPQNRMTAAPQHCWFSDRNDRTFDHFVDDLRIYAREAVRKKNSKDSPLGKPFKTNG